MSLGRCSDQSRVGKKNVYPNLKDLDEDKCMIKRAIAGLVVKMSGKQDLEGQEGMMASVQQQRVLLELTPNKLEVIEDTHEADNIRALLIKDISVINTPQVWLDNHLPCFQVVSSKGNHKGTHVVADYLYGSTDIDFALCFKNEEHKAEWVQSIIDYQHCDQQLLDSFTHQIKNQVHQLQGQQDTVQINRLNKKVHQIVAQTLKLEKYLSHKTNQNNKQNNNKIQNYKNKSRFSKHHSILGDDISKDNTFSTISNNRRFAKKIQLLKLLQQAVNEKKQNKRQKLTQAQKQKQFNHNKQLFKQKQLFEKIKADNRKKLNKQNKNKNRVKNNKRNKMKKSLRFRKAQMENKKNYLKYELEKLVKSYSQKKGKSCPRKVKNEEKKLVRLEDLLEKHEEEKEMKKEKEKNRVAGEWEGGSDMQRKMAEVLRKGGEWNSWHSEGAEGNVEVNQGVKDNTHFHQHLNHALSQIPHAHPHSSNSQLHQINAKFDQLLSQKRLTKKS